MGRGKKGAYVTMRSFRRFVPCRYERERVEDAERRVSVLTVVVMYTMATRLRTHIVLRRVS